MSFAKAKRFPYSPDPEKSFTLQKNLRARKRNGTYTIITEEDQNTTIRPDRYSLGCSRKVNVILFVMFRKIIIRKIITTTTISFWENCFG